MPISTESIESLTASVQQGWKQFLLDEQKRRGRESRTNAKNVYASGYRDCVRRMVLDMVASDKLPPWEPETLANFRRGEDRERDIVSDLKAIGRNAPIPYEVGGEQERLEIKDSKGRVIITGKKDGDFRFSDGTIIPFEVKAYNPATVSRIHEFSDLERGTWTKSAARQILIYLYAFKRELGYFVLDRNGLPALIPVELAPNIEKVEDFLKRAELAMDAKEAYESALAAGDTDADEFLPTYIKDVKTCQRCPFFGSVCQPPTDYGQGAKIIEDEELLEALQTVVETEEAWEKYEGAWKTVSTALRGVDNAIAPGILVQGKWQQSTSYPIPIEVKQKYKVVKEEGKFLLTISKI